MISDDANECSSCQGDTCISCAFEDACSCVCSATGAAIGQEIIGLPAVKVEDLQCCCCRGGVRRRERHDTLSGMVREYFVGSTW